MEDKKVSIILPCYNGEKTIERAVRGVMNQTYRPIQLILVNDGSTDRTEEIVLALKPELEAAGIEVIYVPQENKGLGGAINTGLKHVTGEYLAWVDADDELLPESVAVRVTFLEENPQYGSVSSNAFLVEESNWDHPLGRAESRIELNSEEDQFEHILLARSLFCAGCHLVRTEVFKKANGGMDIYPARHGQNWQMLLPVYYASRHAFLDIPLYKYRINANNMTAEIDRMSLTQMAKRRREYISIIENTLGRMVDMPPKERRRYLQMFKKRMYEQNLDYAIEKQNKAGIMKWRAVVRIMHYVAKLAERVQ